MKKIDAWLLFIHHLGTCLEPRGLFKTLKRAYQRPLRFYHTLDHALECVTHFEQLRGETDHALAIEGALWYHDAICNPKSKDNEEQSAQFAWDEFKAMGQTTDFCSLVKDLILVTKHNGTPKTIEEKIMVDVDLAILGAETERFDKYEKDIRSEYHFVPDEQFKDGRTQLLQSFLERKKIYHTELFFEYYESSARNNLRRSIEKLTA